MNVLLVGGSGFIGLNLVRKLKKENYNVFVIGEKRIDSSFYEIKLSEVDKIKELIIDKEINQVIHLANDLLPNSQSEDFLNSFDNIILPTFELINFCESINLNKFVFFSSGGTIYGNQKNADENTQPSPINYYGYAKQIIEDYILLKSKKGFNGLILRPSNPYGFGQNLNGKQGIIAITLGKIMNDEKLSIYSSMDAKKDYIYIDDLVNITVLLLENAKGIFNIGSGFCYSLNDIFKSVKEVTNHEVKYDLLPLKDEIVHEFILNINKINNLFPKYEFLTLNKGLEIFWNQINGEKNE